jgi:LSD1 subclass zinc finger protein
VPRAGSLKNHGVQELPEAGHFCALMRLVRAVFDDHGFGVNRAGKVAVTSNRLGAIPMPEMKCPKCSQRLKLPEGAVGKRVKCSACEHSFVVDGSQAVHSQEVIDLRPDPAFEFSSQGFAASRARTSRGGLRRIAAVAVAIVGVVTFTIGVFSLFMALGLEITVDASHNERGLRVENRVYNDGLMHKREIEVLTSGTAILSGILMMGFASLHPPFTARAD